MAFGTGERPERSPAAIVQSVDFPARRRDIVMAAEDSEASPDTINFLKSLPDRSYDSVDEVFRYFAEADARFGMHSRDVHHRGNIGKDTTEPSSGPARHP